MPPPESKGQRALLLMLCYACWWFAPAWAVGCSVASEDKTLTQQALQTDMCACNHKVMEVHMYGKTCDVRGKTASSQVAKKAYPVNKQR